MKPPLNDWLLSATACSTSPSDTLNWSSRDGSTTTWNCLVSPPQVFTSLTPGTERRRVRTSQSWVVFADIASTFGPVTTYW